MKPVRWLSLLVLMNFGAAVFPESGAFAQGKAASSKAKRAGESVISQIRPAPSRKARKSLSSMRPLQRSRRRNTLSYYAASRRYRTIADALLIAPSAATAEQLAEYGIPVIGDIPPIVYLSPEDRKDEAEMFGF